MRPIYLDHNATTPLSSSASNAMRPFLDDDSDGFGNPSSSHAYGKKAKDVVEHARAQVASAIGARPEDIVFCGCGSEANTLALTGAVRARLRAGEVVRAVTTTIEHPAVYAPFDALTLDFAERFDVRTVAVGRDGRVDVDSFAEAAAGANLASVMLANNETGTIQPVAAIRDALPSEVLLHVDAAQAVGKIAVDVETLGADYLTVVGHKLGAPKGIAALFVRKGAPLVPLIGGGGHESGRRAGTENVILAAALGAACADVGARLAQMSRIAALRDALESALRSAFGDKVIVNGDRHHRLPNTLNVSVRGVRAPLVLADCPEVAASTGSACHEEGVTLSPVLSAMGVDEETGAGAFRLSLGPETSESDVERAARCLASTITEHLSRV